MARIACDGAREPRDSKIPPLDVQTLGGGFDHEVCIGCRALEVRFPRQVTQSGVGGRLLELALGHAGFGPAAHFGGCGVKHVLADVLHCGLVPGERGGHRDLATHGAGADHGDVLDAVDGGAHAEVSLELGFGFELSPEMGAPATKTAASAR